MSGGSAAAADRATIVALVDWVHTRVNRPNSVNRALLTTAVTKTTQSPRKTNREVVFTAASSSEARAERHQLAFPRWDAEGGLAEVGRRGRCARHGGWTGEEC